MSLDAFSASLGQHQGRIRPSHGAPVSGEFSYVLGNEEPGWFFDLAVGDGAELVQQADLTSVGILRLKVRMSVPASLPSSLAWEISILIDGVKAARARCQAGRARVLSDLAANVSKLTGTHEIGVRLELVGL
jgi:hypothetical protein